MREESFKCRGEPIMMKHGKKFTEINFDNEWGERRGLNPRHPGPQPGALPAELRPPRHSWVIVPVTEVLGFL